MSLDVSVVVCTKNAEATIERCLDSIYANEPRQVIVVDGLSTDMTRERARTHMGWMPDHFILSDDGLGLAHARNVGLDAAKGKYIAYVGPDNLLPPSTLEMLVYHLERNGWIGVSAGTVLAGQDWWARSMYAYKRVRFTPGPRSIIGTPHLWRRDVLVFFRFDDTLTSSDDADLCQRMSAPDYRFYPPKEGHKFGIAPVTVAEIGTTTWPDVKRRWLWYGQSDAEYWAKYQGGWKWRRQLQSILHPLKAEFIEPVSKDFRLLWFCGLITGLRYAGWVRAALRRKHGYNV